MKYSVNVRMKNPGVAKYLIEARDTDDMHEAFCLAIAMVEKHEKDGYFVEVIDNNTNEKVAGFNESAI